MSTVNFLAALVFGVGFTLLGNLIWTPADDDAPPAPNPLTGHRPMMIALLIIGRLAALIALILAALACSLAWTTYRITEWSLHLTGRALIAGFQWLLTLAIGTPATPSASPVLEGHVLCSTH